MLPGMAHRPYPVAARALRQIMRRHRNEGPAALLRGALPTGREAAERGQDGVAALPDVGDYVLSTRRER